MTDPIVDAVCAKLQSRSAVGLKKYGTTLADNAATVKEKLVHIQEELMDGANYVEWLLQEQEMPKKLGCAADDDDLCFPCASKGWVCEKAKERAKDMPTPMTIEMEADERQSVIEKALRRAFIIGQNYWSNADSESRSAWKRADKNKEEFELLIKETIRAALQSPRVPVIPELDEAIDFVDGDACPHGICEPEYKTVLIAARWVAELQKGA